MCNSNETPHIVIVGGGFAGAYCARSLEKQLGRNAAHVTIINRNNDFVFTPLLVEAATGALEPRHAVVPLRRFLRQAKVQTGDVTRVDVDRREVHFQRFDETTSRDLARCSRIICGRTVT